MYRIMQPCKFNDQGLLWKRCNSTEHYVTSSCISLPNVMLWHLGSATTINSSSFYISVQTVWSTLPPPPYSLIYPHLLIAIKKMLFRSPLVDIQYCGKHLFPRGSVLGLRSPFAGFNFVFENGVIWYISRCPGSSPCLAKPACALKCRKVPIYWLINSSIYPFIHPFVHAFVLSFVDSFTRLFVRSLTVKKHPLVFT